MAVINIFASSLLCHMVLKRHNRGPIDTQLGRTDYKELIDIK